jgi:hypothetical protein
MRLPFGIRDGLFLESDDLLIPWGTLLDPEGTPGKPEVLAGNDGWTFVWRSRRALGGLAAEVTARRDRCPSAQSYPSGLPTLEWFLIRAPLSQSGSIPTHVTETVAQLRRFLTSIYDALETAIGPASWSYPGYALGLPSIAWEDISDENGNVLEFACAPTADLSVSVSVGRRTTEHPEFRAEAERLRRQWAQSDARVPFVAWNADDPRIPEKLRAWRIAWSQHQIARLAECLSIPGHPINRLP